MFLFQLKKSSCAQYIQLGGSSGGVGFPLHQGGGGKTIMQTPCLSRLLGTFPEEARAGVAAINNPKVIASNLFILILILTVFWK